MRTGPKVALKVQQTAPVMNFQLLLCNSVYIIYSPPNLKAVVISYIFLRESTLERRASI